MIKGTATPMGKMLTDRPGQQQVGGGRRASTLRSCVRGVRKFLTWLALNRELSYPTSFDQLSEFLHVRLSEPCNRGALKEDPPEFCLSRGNGRNPGTRAIDRISSLWSDLSRTPCVSSTRKALQTGAAHALLHIVFFLSSWL